MLGRRLRRRLATHATTACRLRAPNHETQQADRRANQKAPMNLKFNVPPGQWIKATDLYQALMAKALTGAMRDVGKLGRERGRQAITAAGFSNKFANSLVAKFAAKDTLTPADNIDDKMMYAVAVSVSWSGNFASTELANLFEKPAAVIACR